MSTQRWEFKVLRFFNENVDFEELGTVERLGIVVAVCVNGDSDCLHDCIDHAGLDPLRLRGMVRSVDSTSEISVGFGVLTGERRYSPEGVQLIFSVKDGFPEEHRDHLEAGVFVSLRDVPMPSSELLARLARVKAHQ